MAATVNVTLNIPGRTIAQLNGVQKPTKVREAIQGLINLLLEIEAGTTPATAIVTVRDTDPGVSTSGSGSTQNTYSKI